MNARHAANLAAAAEPTAAGLRAYLLHAYPLRRGWRPAGQGERKPPEQLHDPEAPNRLGEEFTRWLDRRVGVDREGEGEAARGWWAGVPYDTMRDVLDIVRARDPRAVHALVMGGLHPSHPDRMAYDHSIPRSTRADHLTRAVRQVAEALVGRLEAHRTQAGHNPDTTTTPTGRESATV